MSSTFLYDSPIPYDSSQPYDFVASWGGSGVSPTLSPHLSASMVINNSGAFQFFQQGSLDEVSQCVEVVCGTTQGDRTVVPGFGLPQLAFTTPGVAQVEAVVQQAINTWEPRAAVDISVLQNGLGTETITVKTSLRQGSTT